jgi:hypothetical protein
VRSLYRLNAELTQSRLSFFLWDKDMAVCVCKLKKAGGREKMYVLVNVQQFYNDEAGLLKQINNILLLLVITNLSMYCTESSGCDRPGC